jgi:transglutaminase-like putative cysteine protease
MTRVALAAALFAIPSLAFAQQATPIAILADSVAGTGTSAVKTQRLVRWVNDRFEWSATDYVRRTPAEVIARRAGNCAELASVLRLLLDSLHIRSRWVREINVQPGPTPRRQQTAEQKVLEVGKSMSVFGLQHNDHVWLEVWDDSASAWFPADPAYGVVGLGEWLPARLAMANRPKPRVAAVEPIAADMLVPFVVSAGTGRGGPYNDDRTEYYLIDQFDRLYGGRLHDLPAWSSWVAMVRSLSPRARAAFAGQENLHEQTAEIAKLKATYDALGREANARGLRWSR